MFILRHVVLFMVPPLVAVLLDYATAQLQMEARQAAGGLVFGTDPQRWLGEGAGALARLTDRLEIVTIAAIGLLGVISGFLIPVGASARMTVNCLMTLAVGTYVANRISSFPTYPKELEIWAYSLGAAICAYLTLILRSKLGVQRSE